MTKYTILWGDDPDALVNENEYATKAMAWDVYKQLSFCAYAVLMCDGVVIDDNLGRGPVITKGVGE